MKKRLLTFKGGNIKVVAPLDPLEGMQGVELVREEYNVEYIENVYKVTLRVDDYVNPTTMVP